MTGARTKRQAYDLDGNTLHIDNDEGTNGWEIDGTALHCPGVDVPWRNCAVRAYSRTACKRRGRAGDRAEAAEMQT